MKVLNVTDGSTSYKIYIDEIDNRLHRIEQYFEESLLTCVNYDSDQVPEMVYTDPSLKGSGRTIDRNDVRPLSFYITLGVNQIKDNLEHYIKIAQPSSLQTQ